MRAALRSPVLLALAAVAAIVVLPPPVAAAPAGTPASSEPCQVDELDVSAPLNPIPTVYAPGQTATHPATIHNGTSATFTDAFFDFGLVVPPDTTDPGSAPSVSWNIDGGSWRALSLTWMPQPAPNQSYWESDDTALPTLSPGSTHSVKFRVAFHANNPRGFYSAPLSVGARSCGFYHLGDAFQMEYDFYTDLGPTGCCVNGGSSPSHGSTGTGGGHPAKTPSAPAPSPVTTTQPASASTPSDHPQPSATSGVADPPRAVVAHSTGWAWTGGVGLAVLVAAAILGWFVRRPRRPAEIVADVATDDAET